MLVLISIAATLFSYLIYFRISMIINSHFLGFILLLVGLTALILLIRGFIKCGGSTCGGL